MSFHSFKRAITRAKIRFIKISGGRSKMAEDTKFIYAIVRAMVNHPDTKFLTAPISQTYYLENKKLDYFIVLDMECIRITNHKFYASKSVNTSDGDRMVSYVKNHIEGIRKEMENEIFQNQHALYRNIYENLKASID
jgi:hypothetical protein